MNKLNLMKPLMKALKKVMRETLMQALIVLLLALQTSTLMPTSAMVSYLTNLVMSFPIKLVLFHLYLILKILGMYRVLYHVLVA